MTGMMIRISAFLAALTLAACGAEGPPVAPSKAGITLSGQASIGVKVSQ